MKIDPRVTVKKDPISPTKDKTDVESVVNESLPKKVASKVQIKELSEKIPNRGTLNFYAGLSDPKYIKYQQMPDDFEINSQIGIFSGKKGDYLFQDSSGGKAIVPQEIFRQIFKE